MTKCQSKAKSVECSGDNAPEMFAVHGKKTSTTQCLAHAVLAEAKGYRVEIILT